jgi:LysR family pca operon transcriptional activator
MPYHGTIIRQEIDRFLLAQGLEQPANLIETTSVEFGRAYTQQSDAVWFVPRGFMNTPGARATLTELPLDSSALEGPVGITVRSDGRRVAVANLMIDAIQHVAREAAPGA